MLIHSQISTAALSSWWEWTGNFITLYWTCNLWSIIHVSKKGPRWLKLLTGHILFWFGFYSRSSFWAPLVDRLMSSREIQMAWCHTGTKPSATDATDTLYDYSRHGSHHTIIYIYTYIYIYIMLQPSTLLVLKLESFMTIKSTPWLLVPWVPSQYKDSLSRYGSFHYKNKVVVRPSYLCKGNAYTGKLVKGMHILWLFGWLVGWLVGNRAYTGKVTSLYWDSPLALGVTKSSAAWYWLCRLWDKRILAFHNIVLQLPVEYKYWKMTENKN